MILLVIILIVALALRVWQLGSAPPGLTHDEASNGHDAAAVLRGVRPIYFTVGYGHEPFYPYSVAVMMALLGPTDTALRLTTVAWGLILILLSYGLTRKLFGSLPALITAAWMAVSFWCVMTSRVGLRAITTAVTFTASALCFWMVFPTQNPKLKTQNWLWPVLSGVFLGVSIYTYMASRAMPVVYVLFLFYLILVLRLPSLQVKRQFLVVAVIILVAGLVAAPLIHFLITHPEAEQRIGHLSAPLEAAARGDFSGLWRRISRSLPMFTFQGDPLWLYNIPGRPLLDVAGGAFFYAGLLLCLWHWRDPRYAFLLIWLIVGVSPALVTGPDATVLRSIAAQPAIFIIAALALSMVIQFLYRRLGRWGRTVTIGAAVALFALTGVRTVHAYFNIWAQHRDVRVAYHHALVQEAHYLDESNGVGEDSSTVALSSIYPGRFHDPYTMEVTLHRDDLSLRWFDGRFALIFPPTHETRVIIPTIAPLDASLKPLFDEHTSLIHTEELRPDDLISRFDVYSFDAADALEALLPTVEGKAVYWSPVDAYPKNEPQAAYEALSLPVNVGDVVELVSYALNKPAVESGEEIEVLTVWRVRNALSAEAVLFTHLLDHNGEVVGQMDRLDVPSWYWHPGDVFVQVHRFPTNADAPPDLYHLEVGFYTRDDLKRLPVLLDNAVIDDRILLQPIEIRGE